VKAHLAEINQNSEQMRIVLADRNIAGVTFRINCGASCARIEGRRMVGHQRELANLSRLLVQFDVHIVKHGRHLRQHSFRGGYS